MQPVPGDPLAGGREAAPERTFPIQQCGPIPRAAAERAYATYARMFGTKQSLDELGRRGGFTLSEWACLYLGHYPHDHYKFEGCIWKALSELRAPPALSSGPPEAGSPTEGASPAREESSDAAPLP